MKLLAISVASFGILCSGRWFLKKRGSVILYHLCLFSILFILGIGGGGALSDAEALLPSFIHLEKSGQWDHAKGHPHLYPHLSPFDLQAFSHSEDLKQYIRETHENVTLIERIFLGYLMLLIADSVRAAVGLWQGLRRKRRAKNALGS